MDTTKPLPPLISGNEAKSIVEYSYGFTVESIKKLDSYIDLNFLIHTSDQQKFVLKISHTQEEKEVLRAQHLVFNTLQQHHSHPHCFPNVIAASEGIADAKYKGD